MANNTCKNSADTINKQHIANLLAKGQLDALLNSSHQELNDLYTHNGKVRNAIVISSSGGGGHKVAARAKQRAYSKLKVEEIKLNLAHIVKVVEQACEAEDQSCEIDQLLDNSYKSDLLTLCREQIEEAKKEIERLEASDPLCEHDLLGDWVPFGMGKIGTDSWDKAQRNGDIHWQEFLASLHWTANIFIGPFSFIYTVFSLLKNDADIVFVTQANANKGICMAVRFVNYIRRYDIAENKRAPARVDLVMTDMPTERSQHYFCGLRGLSDEDRAVMRLETLHPLTKPDQSEQAFWDEMIGKHHVDGQKGDGITVCYSKMPIRDAFYETEKLTREQIHQNGFNLKINNEDERVVLKQLFEQGIATNTGDGMVNIAMREQDKLQTIMLGSQGGMVIKDYVNLTIDQMIKDGVQGDGQAFFYVFCGTHQPGRDDLFAEVSVLIQDRANEIPAGLHVIPLGRQDDKLIAPLFARTDVDIRRAGGLSTMEGYQIYKHVNPHAQVYVHSDKDREEVANAASADDKVEALLSGIPVWERGNAEYLIDNIGAKTTNVDEFEADCCAFKPLTNVASEPRQQSATSQHALKRCTLFNNARDLDHLDTVSHLIDESQALLST